MAEVASTSLFARAWRSRTAIVAGALLWGGFSLQVPVILLFAYVCCALGIGIAVASGVRMHRLVLIIALNYAYWLMTGLVSGGVLPSDLASLEFFNNDGRVFLYYLPLAFFSFAYATDHDLRTVHRTVVMVACAVLVLMAVWAVVRPGWLSVGARQYYGGLLTSHTGAGTFFGVLAVWLLLYGDVCGSNAIRVLGLLAMIPMLGSGSRQALVSVAAVLAWYTLRRRRPAVILRMLVSTAVVVALLGRVNPALRERLAVLTSPETLAAATDLVTTASWEPSELEPLGGVESNILSRILLWNYAARRFVDSPLTGIGFGRYNDTDLRVEDVGFAAMAVEGSHQTNVYNAHNMYLHVLSESGIVGLFLLLWIWIVLWRACSRAVAGFPVETRAYFVACLGTLVFCLVSALFDNALAAPSLGVPAIALAGSGLARMRLHRRSAYP